MANKLPVIANKYVNKITGTVYKAFKHKIKENHYFMESQSDSPDLVVDLDNFWKEFEELQEDKAETRPKTQDHILVSVDFGKEGSDETIYTFVKKSELSPEVKEAMEKLREEIKKRDWMPYESIRTKLSVEDYYRLKTSATNLLNALDKQFKVNETSESVDFKEEEVNEIKAENGSFKHLDNAEEFSQDIMKESAEESIWKPVSEEVDNQSIIFINKAGYARLAEAWNDKIYFIEGDAGGTNVRSHMIDKTYYGKKFCTLTDFINDYEKLKERVRRLENNKKD